MNKNKKKWAKKHEKGSINQAINRNKDSSREAREAREVSKEGFCVTDHAIYRYLERVKKIDMDDLKNEIVPEDVKKQILYFGKGKFPAKGCRLIVVNKRITTVYE